MTMNSDELYLLIRDQAKLIAAQNTRLEVLEYFIREKFPGDFAGDVGTVVDPELNPVVLNLGPLVSDLRKENNVT